MAPPQEPYLVRVAAGDHASIDAAVAHAAHDTLAAAFPGTTFDLATELEAAVAGVTDEPAAVAAGKAVGRAAARAMIDARKGDGADDNTPYVHSEAVGDWRPTNGMPGASPNWPRVKPFCIASGSQ